MAATLIALAVTSALVVSAIVWGRFRRVTVPRPGRWPVTPMPSVGWADGVQMSDVVTAAYWWQVLGHPIRISDAEEAPSILIVVDDTIDTRASVDDGVARVGLTHREQTNGGTIRSAVIRVVRSDRLVIAHELGHALGYEHPSAPPTGHMMHPSRPGWDSRGLDV